MRRRNPWRRVTPKRPVVIAGHVVLADLDGYEFVSSEGPIDETKSFDEVVGTVDHEAGTKPDPS